MVGLLMPVLLIPSRLARFKRQTSEKGQILELLCIMILEQGDSVLQRHSLCWLITMLASASLFATFVLFDKALNKLMLLWALGWVDLVENPAN